jgi:hypothetical protein
MNYVGGDCLSENVMLADRVDDDSTTDNAPRPYVGRPSVPHMKWFLPSSPEALRINRRERPLLEREGTLNEFSQQPVI